MVGPIRWTLVAGVVLIVGVAPVVYFRDLYAYQKRLKEVVPGRFYRAGQMTADGFEDTLEKLHIRLVINVQDDFPDPDIYDSFLSARTVKESELCRRLGVRYEFIAPDLVFPAEAAEKHPRAIDRFLELLDDEANYPVLLHCKAGLHRTGVLAAVYRMEYQGWTPGEAFRELKAHGFGPWVCSAANQYVSQYVLHYRPRAGRPVSVGHAE
jgi:protein tyrosine/serine phosphatase